MIRHTFREALIEQRKKHQLTQAELGDLIGVGHQCISNYEQGIREPDLETLSQLAEQFECSAVIKNGAFHFRPLEVKEIPLKIGVEEYIDIMQKRTNEIMERQTHTNDYFVGISDVVLLLEELETSRLEYPSTRDNPLIYITESYQHFLKSTIELLDSLELPINEDYMSDLKTRISQRIQEITYDCTLKIKFADAFLNEMENSDLVLEFEFADEKQAYEKIEKVFLKILKEWAGIKAYNPEYFLNEEIDFIPVKNVKVSAQKRGQ